MKLLALWALWLAIYFGTAAAGIWYDYAFNLFNALVSFTLLISVNACYKTWWAKSYGLVCLLQICLNCVDFWANIHRELFFEAQWAFNRIEIVLLFVGGGWFELKRWLDGIRNSGYFSRRSTDMR